MSILFDKWKELTDLEKAQEEEQYLIQEEEEISKRNSKILRGGKFNTFEEMKAYSPSPPISDEERKRRHKEWRKCMEQLRAEFLKSKKVEVSIATRIKQLQVEIGCLEDEIWTLKPLQLEEAKANENNVETPNPQY